MKKIPCSFLWSLFVLGILLPRGVTAAAEYDGPIPGENDRIDLEAAIDSTLAQINDSSVT